MRLHDSKGMWGFRKKAPLSSFLSSLNAIRDDYARKVREVCDLQIVLEATARADLKTYDEGRIFTWRDLAEEVIMDFQFDASASLHTHHNLSADVFVSAHGGYTYCIIHCNHPALVEFLSQRLGLTPYSTTSAEEIATWNKLIPNGKVSHSMFYYDILTFHAEMCKLYHPENVKLDDTLRIENLANLLAVRMASELSKQESDPDSVEERVEQVERYRNSSAMADIVEQSRKIAEHTIGVINEQGIVVGSVPTVSVANRI